MGEGKWIREAIMKFQEEYLQEESDFMPGLCMRSSPEHLASMEYLFSHVLNKLGEILLVKGGYSIARDMGINLNDLFRHLKEENQNGEEIHKPSFDAYARLWVRQT